jgi:hypothetical protein
MIKKKNQIRFGKDLYIVENVNDSSYLLKNLQTKEINWVKHDHLIKSLEPIVYSKSLNEYSSKNAFVNISLKENDEHTIIDINDGVKHYYKVCNNGKTKALESFSKDFKYFNQITPKKLLLKGFTNDEPVIITEAFGGQVFYHGSHSKDLDMFESKMFWSTSLDFAECYGPIIYKAQLDLGRTFDISIKQHFNWLLKQAGGKLVYTDDNAEEQYMVAFNQYGAIKNNNWELVENYLKIIKREFDSCKITEQGTINFVVFKESQIRLLKKFSRNLEESFMIICEGITDLLKYYPKLSEEKIRQLVALDPTYKGGDQLGKFGKWILNIYNRGNLKEEDFYKVKDYLTTFKLNYNKMTNKDLNSYKGLPELYDAIKDYIGQQDVSHRQEVRDIKQGAEKAFEDDKWLVIIPHTQEAACYYGKNTQWCTAATSSENMFNYYNKQGPLYININKKTNEKFQFHFQSEQFMDERDEPIEPNSIFKDDEKFKDFYLRLAILYNMNVKRIIEYFFGDENQFLASNEFQNNEELQLSAIEDYFNDASDILKYIKNPSERVVRNALYNSQGYAIRYIKNPTEEEKKYAVTIYGRVIQYIDNPSEEVQRLAIKDDGNNIQYIDNPSEEFIKLAIDSGATLQSFYDNLSDEWKIYALKKNHRLIYNIDNPTDEMIMAVISDMPDMFAKIKNPSEEMMKQAMDINRQTLSYMENIPESIQMYAVQKSWTNIRYIKNPCKEAQMFAVRKGYDDAYKMIKNPCKEATDYIKSMKMYNLDEAFDGISSNKNFMEWFSDSKIVDSRGEPLLCYHCSDKQFDDFDENMIGKRDYGWYGKGIYFSPYQNDHYGQYCKECYLKIENPYYYNTDSEIDSKADNDLYRLLVPHELYSRIDEFKQRRKDFINNATVSKKPSNVPNEVYYTVKYNGQEWSDGESYNPKTLTDDDIKWMALNSKAFGSSFVTNVRKFEKTLDNYIDNMVHQKGFNSRGELKTAKLISLGYDGVIVSRYDNLKNPEMADEIVVFRKNQIKSVENNGNFSRYEDNINEDVDE